MTARDPREQRAAVRAALDADPERRARVGEVAARIRALPEYRYRAATRPRTASQAWADFDAAEARIEHERDDR